MIKNQSEDAEIQPNSTEFSLDETVEKICSEANLPLCLDDETNMEMLNLLPEFELQRIFTELVSEYKEYTKSMARILLEKFKDATHLDKHDLINAAYFELYMACSSKKEELQNEIHPPYVKKILYNAMLHEIRSATRLKNRVLTKSQSLFEETTRKGGKPKIVIDYISAEQTEETDIEKSIFLYEQNARNILGSIPKPQNGSIGKFSLVASNVDPYIFMGILADSELDEETIKKSND